MPATQEDRLYGLTTSVAVKPPVLISVAYNIPTYGEQTINSSTINGDITTVTTPGMRILLMGQTNPIDNGIWVSGPAAWARAPDFDGARDAVNGTLVFSTIGEWWQLEATDPVRIGYSPLRFNPFPHVGCARFDTVMAVALSNIPPATNFLNVIGYYTAGDGGAANYKKVDSEPAHPGKIQSADGAWWEFVGIEINLYQTGCKGDSTSGVTGSGTDDTLSFMKARDVALALDIPVIIPALLSTKAFRLTSIITHSGAITYLGVGASVTSSLVQSYPDGGSWLYLDHLDNGLRFRDEVTPSNNARFVRMCGLGIDRNQAAPAVGWEPTAAQHDLRFEYTAEIEDITFLKSSRMILIRGAGNLQSKDVKGQPLLVGYECERSADVQRWVGSHFWSYWSQDINVINYTKLNALCHKIQRADGLFIDNAFGIFYKRLFYAVDAVGAGAFISNFHLRNPYADIGGGGIEIVSNNYSAYGTIEGYLCNSDVGGNATEGAAFRLSGIVPSNIQLGMRSNRSPGEAVYVSGSSHRVTLKASSLAGWSFVDLSRYAIRAFDGASIILDNVPDLATGNGLYYSHDGSSSIIFPVTHGLRGAAASPQGFLSTRVTIADNSVAVIPAPGIDFTANMHIAPVSAAGAGSPAGSVWLRANASPSSAIIGLNTTTNISVVTGVLTGSTGTAGNLTISAANTNNFYIENRTGASKTFIITLLGN
ncbi:hypothetical protein [Yersinia proxima]|uniref:hypothetical protein n=1 Tax=Yersinia proxima TaxID=2890316 RepID=UPI001D1093A9|nr:hypothetical protein [Yersinia proxima]